MENVSLLTIGDIGVATFNPDNYLVKWTATTTTEKVFQAMREFYKSVRSDSCLSPANETLFDSRTDVMVLSLGDSLLKITLEQFLDEEMFMEFLDRHGAKHLVLTNPYTHSHYITESGKQDLPTRFNFAVAARRDIGRQLADLIVKTTSDRCDLPKIEKDLGRVVSHYSTGNFIPYQTPQQQD